jgi:hypothetical protein
MRSFTSPHRRFRALAVAGFALLIVPALASLSTSPHSSSPHQPQKAANRYIGAAQCKLCHQSKDTGDQHSAWLKEKHSKAHATLATDKAKSLAKEKGIADPQKSEKCLKCHVTAFGRPKEEFHASFDVTLGVQCETCHGPGEKHKKARMAAAAAADEKAAPKYTAIPDDEVVKQGDPKTCAGCHNPESPSYQPFCYHKFAAQIRHLNPQKPRTDAEKAALTACACDDKCACKSGPDRCSAGKPPDAKAGKEEPKK